MRARASDNILNTAESTEASQEGEQTMLGPRIPDVRDEILQEKLQQVASGESAKSWLIEQIDSLLEGITNKLASVRTPDFSLSDIKQMLAFKVFERIPRCTAKSWGEFIEFARTVANNAGIDHLRSMNAKKRRGLGRPQSLTFKHDSADPTSNPSEQASRNELSSQFTEVTEKMDDDCDRSIMVAYYYGLGPGVISEILGIKVDEVQKRLKRLRTTLRKELDGNQ